MPPVSPKRKAERTYKPIIVIDPGHGGHDSGAMKNGTVEKDVGTHIKASKDIDPLAAREGRREGQILIDGKPKRSVRG